MALVDFHKKLIVIMGEAVTLGLVVQIIKGYFLDIWEKPAGFQRAIWQVREIIGFEGVYCLECFVKGKIARYRRDKPWNQACCLSQSKFLYTRNNSLH